MKKRRKIVVEKHLVTEEPKPVVISCANCSQPCTTFLDRNKKVKMEKEQSNCVHEICIDLNKQDSHRGAEKINVKTALSLIYKLKVVHELNLDGSADEEIVLCDRCGELLQTLYILYDEFDHLREQDSYLQKKVSQLDELLAQLQETWTEMANMEKLQNNDEKADAIEPVVKKKLSTKSTPVKTGNDDADGHEVMFVEEKKKEVRREFVDLTLPTTIEDVSHNKRNNIVQQPQRFNSTQPSSSSSSYSRVQPKDSCSNLERQILEEIQAITGPPVAAAAASGGISHTNNIIFNDDDDDPADIHFHNEADFDYEDETVDDDAAFEAIAKAVRYSENNMNMASAAGQRGNYWDESEDAIVGLQDDSMTNSSSNTHSDRDNRLSSCSYCFKKFVYASDLADHVAACPYNRTNVFDTEDMPNDDADLETDEEIDSPVRLRRGSDDSDWGSSSKSRKYKRTPRLGRKPATKIFENCPLCPEDQPVFGAATERSEHFLSHHENQKLKKNPKCSICGKTVTTFGSLRTHLRGHAADFRFVCERSSCGRSFLTGQQLDLHCCTSGQPPPPSKPKLKPVVGGRRVFCKGKTRKGIVHKYPTNKHNMTVYTSCPMCNDGVNFDQPSALSNHWWYDHRTSSDEKDCRICQKVMASPASLKIHYKAHAADHEYVCPDSSCARGFLTAQQMEKHCLSYGHYKDGERGVGAIIPRVSKRGRSRPSTIGNGSGARRYWVRAKVPQIYKSCPLCPEGLSTTFAYPSDFTHHLWSLHRPKMDEGRPVSCPICQKSFVTTLYLKTHFQAHAGDRKFHCPYPQCGLSFLARHQLKNHEIHFHPNEGQEAGGTNEPEEDDDGSVEMVQVGDDDDDSKSPSDVEMDNLKMEN